jgi:prevent-host-death family protein
MKTISHRELRNSSGAVLKAVAAGESYIVTNDGTPVARVGPIDAPVSELRCTRRAKVNGGFADLTRYRIAEAVTDALDELRGDR